MAERVAVTGSGEKESCLRGAIECPSLRDDAVRSCPTLWCCWRARWRCTSLRVPCGMERRASAARAAAWLALAAFCAPESIWAMMGEGV